MNRSVRALWRSAFGVGVLGLTLLWGGLGGLEVITIDLGTLFKRQSNAPVNFGSLAKTTLADHFHLVEYASVPMDVWAPIDAWVEIDDSGEWRMVRKLLDYEGFFDADLQSMNSGGSPQQKPAEDRQEATTTSPAPPPLRYVALLHLDERRGNLKMELQLQISARESHEFRETTYSMNLKNHRLAMVYPTAGWSGTSPPFPAGVTDALTLLTGEIKQLEKDREVTRHIRLQVRPRQIARSGN